MRTLREAKEALRVAEGALEGAIKRQSKMELEHYQTVSEVVHDIRNPLSAMIGHVTLMRSEGLGALNRQDYDVCIESIHSSSLRLLDICDSLLGKRTPATRVEEEDQVVNVAALINEVHSLFSVEADERGVDLQAEVSKEFPDLKANPRDLYRALMNLVSNAIKFTPRGGKVKILAELDPKAEAIIMVVRDSGVGMTMDQIREVTQPNVTTVSPHGDVGTGHGLAIVNRIVSEMNGKLEIVSTENQGTKIKLCLPGQIAIRQAMMAAS